MSEQHEDVSDAVVVEEVNGQHIDVDASSESHAAGSALAVRAPSREVLMPMDTESVIEGMAAYQAMLPKLLTDSDYQDDGRGGKFVKKSGWRKIARAFNLSVVRISDKVERDINGEVLRAEATYRAIAPNGQTQDGDGYCAREESRFTSEGGRAKLENDLRATATTRAKNRAISDLVGMGEVSAEEVQPGGESAGAAPAATQEQVDIFFRSLLWLFEGDDGKARAAFGLVERTCGGTITRQVADSVVVVLGARKKEVDPAPPGDPATKEAKPKSDKKSKPPRESKEAKQRRERKERADAAAAEQDQAAEQPDEHPPEPGADDAPADLPPA